MQIVDFFCNFAAKNNPMVAHAHITSYFIPLFFGVFFVACQPQPQQARHLSKAGELDSVMMEQLQLNTHLADAADNDCALYVQNDSVEYAMDDMGFWYAKTIAANADTVQRGQELSLHIQVSELRGTLISDVKHHHVVGNGEFPTAIARSLNMMGIGDQMRIIAPWYTAYGVEGTNIIKPYSNLLIIITIEE